MATSNKNYRQVYISKVQQNNTSNEEDDISSFCQFLPTKVILKRPRTNLTKSFDSFDGYFQSNDYANNGCGIQGGIQSALDKSINVLLWRFGLKPDVAGGEEFIFGNIDLVQHVLKNIYQYQKDNSNFPCSNAATMSLEYSLSHTAIPGDETDRVFDCLASATGKSPLLSKIRQHEDGTFYMEGQSEVIIEDEINAEFVLEQAKLGMRMIRKNNSIVKRWHHLTQITVYKEDVDSGDMIVQKIQILNVCPAERPTKSSAATTTKTVCKSKPGKRAARPAKKVKPKEDRTLKAFHRIIDSLAQQNSHKPFRDSKLTRLIAKSMDSGAYNIAIVHVGNCGYDEVNMMMEFAAKLKSIPGETSKLSPEAVISNRAKSIEESERKVELLANKVGMEHERDGVLVLKAATVQLDMDSPLDLVELQRALCRYESLQIDPLSVLKRNSTEWFSSCK